MEACQDSAFWGPTLAVTGAVGVRPGIQIAITGHGQNRFVRHWILWFRDAMVEALLMLAQVEALLML